MDSKMRFWLCAVQPASHMPERNPSSARQARARFPDKSGNQPQEGSVVSGSKMWVMTSSARLNWIARCTYPAGQLASTGLGVTGVSSTGSTWDQETAERTPCS